MKKIVVGFNVENNNKDYFDKLTDRQKHELSLIYDDSIIYDSPEDFFEELNCKLINTENYYWYIINIQ